MPAPTWSPTPAFASASAMDAFRAAAQERSGIAMPTTVELHRWSVEQPGEFWSLVWEWFGVAGEPGSVAHRPTTLPEACFFPEASVNLAENLLAPWADSDAPAVICVGEGASADGDALTGRELCRRVASFAQALRDRDVAPGDRVGLVVPAGVDALVATLGALAVGAVVSSVSPEFGAPSVIDRLGQLEPVVLVGALAYPWNGTVHDRADSLGEIVRALPTLRTVFVTDGSDGGTTAQALGVSCEVTPLDAALSASVPLAFTRLPFDHVAYVLFSSGTTGKPKCLMHRAGGVLLKHLVELGLHSDIRAGDRLLFYTTTSWMMWNWEVSCLALGATVVIHQGSPTYPDSGALFASARATGTTHLGVSARLLDHVRHEGRAVDLRTSAVREVLVTGSPLSVPTAQWLAGELGPDVMINPISGGTDLVGCFIGGDPTRPFHAGEMTGPVLGMAVDVLTAEGERAADDEPGELVCLAPFPTVPVGLWGDDTGARLHAAYFDRWPGVWVHGDVAVRSADGGIAIRGRSDATLNVAGVRIGTAEIYAALADHPDVADCLAFGQEWDGDTRIVLLVVPPADRVVDQQAVDAIRAAIRAACSPRHVPALVLGVSELPRTHSGKMSELAVREAVHGRPVGGIQALANPQSLDEIVRTVHQHS